MRRFIVALVFVVAACSGAPAAPPPVATSPAVSAVPTWLRLDAGTLVGDGGLAVGSYRIVDDSVHVETRLEISQEKGYGDDLTWCSWWVSPKDDPEGEIIGESVANDDDVVTLTAKMVGGMVWGDCLVAPVDPEVSAAG